MSLAVYPGPDLLPGLTYSSKWSPQFFNETATTASGAEIDVGLAQYPLHDFELTYAFLRDGPVPDGNALTQLELRTMMGFFLQIGGSLGRFLYKHRDDRRVWQNQIGVGDGSTTVFTLTRTFGANGYTASEPVGQVDSGPGEPFNVYQNGSATPLDPSLYTLSVANPCANTLTFGTAPPNGQAIAVDMAYFYYCKLAANAATFERFMDRLYKVGKIRLHSCRPGA